MTTTDITAPERRIAALNVQEADLEKRTITGIAVPYNEPANINGRYVEIMAPGVFKKSIKEAAASLPLLAMHNREERWPIGKAIHWEDTAKALLGTWEFADTGEAREAYGMIRDGFSVGLSVGFQPIRNDVAMDGDIPVVTRLEARMLETSVVSTPQYQSSVVTMVRTAGVKPPTMYRDKWRERFSGLLAPTKEG